MNLSHFSLQRLIRQTLGAVCVLDVPELSQDLMSAVARPALKSGITEVESIIPVNRVRDSETVCYVSAIALKLSNLVNIPPLDLAQRLLNSLSQSHTGDPVGTFTTALTSIWSTLVIQVQEPGWIYFQLSDRGIASWLHLLTAQGIGVGDRSALKNEHPESGSTITHNFSGNDSGFLQISHSIFEIQHAHARCCSLLRNGEREGYIQLAQAQILPPIWCIADPHPISWMTPDGQLRLRQEAEYRLIARLFEMADEVADRAPKRNQVWKLKKMQELSQDFQRFHQDCQIFAGEKTVSRRLAQARLGLVLATQRTISSEFQAAFRGAIPEEL